MDCSSTSSQPTTPVTTNSNSMVGDYAIMNPVLGRRIVAPQPQLQSTQSPIPLNTKKTALVTFDPDKVLANTQVKTSIDGFKPISSRADKEVYQQNKSAAIANASFSRQHSAPGEKLRKPLTEHSGYEMLELRSSSSSHSMGGRIARPNSVNSEKTTFTPLMRPNSANSERQSTSTFSLTSTPLNETGTQSVCSFSFLWLTLWILWCLKRIGFHIKCHFHNFCILRSKIGSIVIINIMWQWHHNQWNHNSATIFITVVVGLRLQSIISSVISCFSNWTAVTTTTSHTNNANDCIHIATTVC